MFYYTDFDTFRLIIQNGTLRFKESTKSNDKLDTNVLYNELKELFADRYVDDNSINAQIKFLIGFFESRGYKNNLVPIVACFTEKADSRLLWDAYTMNRKDRKSEKYNGVCIQINRDHLANALQKECSEEDLFVISSILYKKDDRRKFLEKKLNEFDKSVNELMHDKDQSQNIIPTQTIVYGNGGFEIDLKKCIVLPMMRFLNDLQIFSPLFKHEFWMEEAEIRAVFCKPTDTLKKLSDETRYYDIHITNDLFEKVILGPEFTEKDMDILKKQDNSIDLNRLLFVPSAGTGVITSKN